MVSVQGRSDQAMNLALARRLTPVSFCFLSGLFLYDEDSHHCYFNPYALETSDQFFLVGVVLGLAIYNSTILDVALPPFAFRKLLGAAPAPAPATAPSHWVPPKQAPVWTLDDLAEYRPQLARGLQRLLDCDGDVVPSFGLTFHIDVDRYGAAESVPLCPGGMTKPVTNANRREYVALYVQHLLETSVARQFDPFKRGFYTVCGGNALSLFRPEEIELLIRGSDEALDVDTLRGAATYQNWGSKQPEKTEPTIQWFWQSFAEASPQRQRRLLLFISGSDRIPATGAASLSISLSCLGDDCGRFPTARTCFNTLSLWRCRSRERLESLLWRAVYESEGFGFQ
jgi:E3 ubiquitin-protein ligase HECTD2